jgi:hypothetical protein
MHYYSTTDANEKRRILLLIAIVAIISTWEVSSILSKQHVTLPWWFIAPSVIGVYGLLYTLFDKYVWKIKALHKLSVIKTPNLEGDWEGMLISSFDPNSSKTVNVKISQTWTEIEIVLRSDSSQSHSIAAFISSKEPGGAAVIYQYQNNPKVHAVDTMEIHYGTTKLTLIEEGKLEGEYYSGRGRQNYGSLSLKKKS